MFIYAFFIVLLYHVQRNFRIEFDILRLGGTLLQVTEEIIKLLTKEIFGIFNP